jgi:hypothetical protein
MRTFTLLLLLCAAARPDVIRVSEAVVDPQADHSENSGGNGTPYDSTPGTGTVSTVDEFVELHNGTPYAVDLTGYSLSFVDTSPSSYVFGSTTGSVLLFTPNSSLTSFLPGGYLVLGNPPGSMNNDVDVQLFDPFGLLVDVLPVRNGGASGAGDEAISRVWMGLFVDETQRTAITPLGAPPYTPPSTIFGAAAGAASGAAAPEPGTLLLTILGGAIPIVRRARRATRRRPGAGPLPPCARP